MSRRRWISTEASIDETLNALGEEYGGDLQLFYLLCIPHATDDGILHGSVGEIRNRVFPSRQSITKMVVARFLYILHESGMLIWDYENDMVILPRESFYKYQTYIPKEKRRMADPEPAELPPLETILSEIEFTKQRKTPKIAEDRRRTAKISEERRETPKIAETDKASDSKASGDDVQKSLPEESVILGEPKSAVSLDLESKDKDLESKDKDKDLEPKDLEPKNTHTALSKQKPPSKRKTGVRKGVRYEYPPEFEEFWKAYAKPGDKAHAYECYKARIEEGDCHELIMEGTRRYMKAMYYNRDPADRDVKFLKNASTFLGPRRYFAEWATIDPDKMSNGNKISEPSPDEKIDAEARELKMFNGNVKLWERWKRDGKPDDIAGWRAKKGI
jgi:hypothetical protein